MRMRATRNKFIAAAMLALVVAARAQTPPPAPTNAVAMPALPPPPSVPALTNSVPAVPMPAPSAITAPSDGVSSALDYLFNRKPQDGSVAQTASTLAGGMGDKLKASDVLDTPPGFDDPVVRQRFEIYLRHPETAPDRIRDYLAKIDAIDEQLKDSTDAFAAWKLLYTLGDDPDLDAGISRELAHRVEAVWNTRRTNNGIDAKNAAIQHEIERSDHNADLIADELRTEDEDRQARVGAGTGATGFTANPAAPTTPDSGASGSDGPAAPSSDHAPGSMQLTAEYLRGLEDRAKVKLNEVQQDANVKQAKADFADYVTTLYGSHRYLQVVLAAGFYRQLFNEGDYPVDMANEVNASLEIDNNVRLAIDDFRDEAAKGEVAGAARMLEAAFLGNEFHPALQGVPLAQKEKVSAYLQKLDVLRNAIEARDFGRIDDLLAQLGKLASDFDATKPLALVNAVKLESTLRLGQARMLIQQGDTKGAMEQFQAAAQAWPGNPDLRATATGYFGSQDLKNQSLAEFDRLVQERNGRAIAAKQLIFAPAVEGDTVRTDQLKAAVARVQTAEAATNQADALELSGDDDGAWETIERATHDWPDDAKLNQQLAGLAGRASDFVAAISRARSAEEKRNLGFSLTWYLNAQHLYPPSRIANDGIARLSRQLLTPPGGSPP
jgi:thioredoxin-like negative regulator of GroEL